MAKSKSIREKGKFQFSRYFQQLEEGDRVAIVKEISMRANFPERLQGQTGVIAGKQGSSYIVKLKEQNKEKVFIIQPIHLKKLQASK